MTGVWDGFLRVGNGPEEVAKVRRSPTCACAVLLSGTRDGASEGLSRECALPL